MNTYQDIYFFSFESAYEVAKQQNMINDTEMQICFYDGEEQITPYKNLINMPFQNIKEILLSTDYRFPKQINFNGLSISDEEQTEINLAFSGLLDNIIKEQRDLIPLFAKEINTQTIDFSEPLRIAFFANKTTKVLQHNMKNMANTFKALGYNVLFDMDNELEHMTQYRIVKKIYTFKPHLLFSINYNYGNLLNNNTFQTIWYQDPMLDLTDNSKISLRERDMFFSLVKFLDYFLTKKNIPFQRQGFCTNLSHNKPNIQKEKKVVFIGSSYSHFIKNDKKTLKVINYIMELLNQGISFTDSVINEISTKFDYDKEYLQSRLLSAVIRDYSVIWLCKIQSEFTIEIYGNGWKQYDEVKPFYKGILQYGNEIDKVYASATYALAPHQSYTLQTRVFEAALNDTISIVYDCRDISDEENYSDALCYFKTFDDLQSILLSKESYNKNFTRLLDENSYDNFAKKIIKQLNTQLKDNEECQKLL